MTPLTPEQLKRFDEASNHPYECECALCKEWWSLVPPEEDSTPKGPQRLRAKIINIIKTALMER